MRCTVHILLLAIGILLCAPRIAAAADPQSYLVELADSGNAAMDALLQSTSELNSLRSTAPVSPFGLIARARRDVDRLKIVLESFGYYDSAVVIHIDGRGLGDLDLADHLVSLPKGAEARVTVGFELGPQYHLGKVEIDGEVPDLERAALGLAPGAPAVAATVLAAGVHLQDALQENGYAFAKVDPPIAYQDLTEPLLDVSFHVESGPRVTVGEILITGLKNVRDKTARAQIKLRTGEPYSAGAVERARHDLLGLGLFSSVSVQLGAEADANGGVPITFAVRERPRHAASINAAYSSDLGGNGGLTWTDRDLFGGAEQLIAAASITNIGGQVTTGLGYDASLKYIVPNFGRRDQALQLAASAINQSLQAYDQNAVTVGATLDRRISSIWRASAGLSGTVESILQEGVTRDYTLVALPLSVYYDTTHLSSPLDDPTHGVRIALTVTPTHAIGPPSANFVINQLRASAYWDLQPLFKTDAGRSVLAVRALGGYAAGAGDYSLPPDQRFYAGGSGTIRGYAYQSVGPRFTSDGNPVGGTSIVAGGIEFRQRFGKEFGAVLFVDGGAVGNANSASLGPGVQTEPGVFSVGVGGGLRYYTPIGPIRLDLAFPTRIANSDRFEIYIGLGQAY